MVGAWAVRSNDAVLAHRHHRRAGGLARQPDAADERAGGTVLRQRRRLGQMLVHASPYRPPETSNRVPVT